LEDGHLNGGNCAPFEMYVLKIWWNNECLIFVWFLIGYKLMTLLYFLQNWWLFFILSYVLFKIVILWRNFFKNNISMEHICKYNFSFKYLWHYILNCLSWSQVDVLFYF
jgi:hypothetical protein